MGYYIRHTLFLKEPDDEKLAYLDELLQQQDVNFILAEESVFDYNGEPQTVKSISDINWNLGGGFKWYDFDHNMKTVSVVFNQKYPDEEIFIYIHTEDGHEAILTFLDGHQRSDCKIYHYREELEKVCLHLNEKPKNNNLQLYKAHVIENHPTVLHHDGAYVMIGYNVFELFRARCSSHYSLESTDYHNGHWNYNSLPFKAKAMNILHDFLVEERINGDIIKFA